MTAAEMIDGILDREQGYQNHPADRGNKGIGTNWGITPNAWGIDKGLGRLPSIAEMKAITRAQAVDFYQRRYIDQSPFKFVAYEPLKVQLIDFGINSGNDRAIRWWQRSMGVPVTGMLDDRTYTAMRATAGLLLNNALVAARLRMIDAWTDGDASQKPLEEGVESRALSFFRDTA